MWYAERVYLNNTCTCAAVRAGDKSCVHVKIEYGLKNAISIPIFVQESASHRGTLPIASRERLQSTAFELTPSRATADAPAVPSSQQRSDRRDDSSLPRVRGSGAEEISLRTLINQQKILQQTAARLEEAASSICIEKEKHQKSGFHEI